MKKNYFFSLATFLFLLFSYGNVFAQQSKTAERIPDKEIKINLKSKSNLNVASLAATGSIEVAGNATYNAYSVQQLVDNLLISGCLTTSNIRFGYYKKDGSSWNWENHSWSTTAGNRQLGYFSKGTSSFALDEGVLFSTGKISSAVGPNNTGSKTDEMVSNAGDPDLFAITGVTMRDASILEFDFVPEGNIVEFKFVFASEEYLEYVHTQYNDAFGFFLSGPGISGGYTNNAVNLAVLPSNEAVTINNIHSSGTNVDVVSFPNHNASYYVNNPNGSTTMQYDGYTTVLIAKYTVQPGQTYKIKMAIADASDQRWDAGVFLKARSFASNTVVITNPESVCFPNTVDITNASITTGSSSELSFTYWQDVNATIPYNTPTTATNGTYYIKGTNTVSGCFEIKPVVVTVNNVQTTETIALHKDLVCFGDSDGSFTVTATGGIGAYSYSIDNIDFSNTSGVFSGLTAGTYTVYVKDINGCEDLSPLTITITEPAIVACNIIKDNCPPSDLEPVCATSELGSVVFWTPPHFSYQCCSDITGDQYSFFMEFDLPESLFGANCWVFNYAQRVGTDNLRLFQSTGSVGSKYTDSFFISPTQYFDNSNGTDVNIELIDVTATVNWTLQVLDPNTNAVLHSYNVPGITVNGQQTITIPNTVANGSYKLKFNFASSNAGGGDKIEVDRVYYNATILDLACAGGINFVVTSTHNPGDLFPIGTTQVTYTATYTPLSGSPVVNTCVFNVTVNDAAKPTGDAIQNFCITDSHTVADLVATGNNIQWYEDATGGSVLATTVTLINGEDYYATQTIGNCESISRFKVDVTISNPNAPTGDASQSFCSIDLPTIANLVALGDNIQWYSDSTNRTPLETTDLLVDGETYYASQTIDGCESDTRLAVTVTVSDPAAPTGDATQTFCSIDSPTTAD
ncbi:MAG: choice-of-anchor L domain-containing protein, partial [Lutibacter sp.]|nr:choice-of-anchor L domain-containing protein [Lutibacter sp.]